MAMTPDVNVLLAAARTDHSDHQLARAWLTTVASTAPGPLLLFPMVVASFLRLIINPRVFPRASSPREALGFIDGVLAAPGARMPELGSEWPAFRAKSLALEGARPNDVPDLWLAAAVQTAGDHLVTFDTGFRRLLKRNELTILA